MPNHVHGVLEIVDQTVPVGTGRGIGINRNANVRHDAPVGTGRDLSLPLHRDLSLRRDETESHDLSLRDDGTGGSRPAPTKIKSLSELIGAYKTTTSKLIHQIPFPHFAWQRSFHDHIIKNERAYRNIYQYITQNPAMWDRDRNNI
jgi:hypothetical protein